MWAIWWKPVSSFSSLLLLLALEEIGCETPQASSLKKNPGHYTFGVCLDHVVWLWSMRMERKPGLSEGKCSSSRILNAPLFVEWRSYFVCTESKHSGSWCRDPFFFFFMSWFINVSHCESSVQYVHHVLGCSWVQLEEGHVVLKLYISWYFFAYWWQYESSATSHNGTFSREQTPTLIQKKVTLNPIY